MEVEHGWRSELRKRKEEKKEDEKASNGRGIEEMTTPGWQKVWYKRLGQNSKNQFGYFQQASCITTDI